LYRDVSVQSEEDAAELAITNSKKGYHLAVISSDAQSNDGKEKGIPRQNASAQASRYRL
jgi:hypothetical protein